MRALFANGAALSSVLRKLDARTKLTVTAATALLTVASSGMLAQLVILPSRLFMCCCSSAPVWLPFCTP